MSDKKLGFFESFMLFGVSAGVSKTAAGSIERVKLLVQNQDEMIKQGPWTSPIMGSSTALPGSLRLRESTHSGGVS